MMRERLVAARRFVLDDRMSTFLGDLSSISFADQIGKVNPKLRNRMADQMRVSARLPHKSVWIEYNLRNARIRSNEILKMEGNPAEMPKTEGWLIEQHPSLETAFQVNLFETDDDGQAFYFPFCYAWSTTDDPPPWRSIFKTFMAEYSMTAFDATSSSVRQMTDSELATGLVGYQTDHTVIMLSDLMAHPPKELIDPIRFAIKEWMSTIRRVWALLSTLNDIPQRQVEVVQSHGFIGQGRYRHFLDHKTITLHVPETRDLRKLARQIVAIARRRAHQVRGHWREDWRQPPSSKCAALLETQQHAWNAEGICESCRGHRLWIHEHQRGDASLGFVTHDYAITHGET